MLADAQRVAHIGSWERHIASGRLRWSDEACRIFGIPAGSFPGTLGAYLEFVHPDDRDKAAPSAGALETGVADEVVYRIVRPDGQIRILQERGEVVRDENGHAARYVGSTQDITDQVAADAEHSLLASAVEQAGDSIWVTDLEHVVTYVNPAFTRVYGYAPREIVGKYAGMVDAGRQGMEYFDAIWAHVQKGPAWAGSIVNRRKDGTLFEVEAVISAIRDQGGAVIGYMQTDRDVSRERALESALERSAREREAVERALARIDPTGSALEIATSAAVEIGRLPDVTGVRVWSLHEHGGELLASLGELAVTAEAGSSLPRGVARHLLDRSTGGPWIEAQPHRWWHRVKGADATAPVVAVAIAPIRGTHGPVGMISIASRSTPTGSPGTLVEQLPALTTFASILGALLAPRLEETRSEDVNRAAIGRILSSRAFAPVFQPIVELRTEATVGFEALTRFRDRRAPEAVFATASRFGLGVELEAATLEAALAAAWALPPGTYLSVNASPRLVLSGLLTALVAGREHPIVIELTEYEPIKDYAELRHTIDALRPTVRLAVDDAGAGFASLRHILELRPDIVKLDRHVVQGIDRDPAREALVAGDRKSTRLNSSHIQKSRMPSSA